jgi:hypothetical protein
MIHLALWLASALFLAALGLGALLLLAMAVDRWMRALRGALRTVGYEAGLLVNWLRSLPAVVRWTLGICAAVMAFVLWGVAHAPQDQDRQAHELLQRAQRASDAAARAASSSRSLDPDATGGSPPPR